MKYQEIIHLGNQQVENQKAISREIAKSNLVGAQIVATEISHQTHALSNTINKIGKQILGAIFVSTEKICDSIDRLGDRLCFELSEIQWQLIQQQTTQEKMLEILYNSRNNEARQLVNQGIRLYVNGEIEEAEERFKRALNYDATDYQILMNLGFIERSKGCVSSALSYFDKALKRPQPEKLDPVSKARTLWAIASLYREGKNFDEAFLYAKEACNQDNHENPKNIYSLGVYASLAGETNTALDKIEQAIRLDPSYLTRDAVEPDLGTIKQEVLELLSRLSTNAELEAKQLINDIKNTVTDLESVKSKYVKNRYDNFLIKVHKHLRLAIENMKNPSYSTCLQSHTNLNILKEAVTKIKPLFDLYAQNRNIQKDFSNNDKKISELKKESNPEDTFFVFPVLLIVIGYIFTSFFIANNLYQKDPTSDWWGIFIAWPVSFLIGLVLSPGFILGLPDPYGLGLEFLICLKFILIFGISILIISGIFYRIFWHKRILKFKQNQTEIKNIENQNKNKKSELENIENKMKNEKENLAKLLSEIKW